MIRIDHVSKFFGGVCAVQDLCLEIPRGQLFCFLGPNGAGKTTTIKMLTGLLKPSAGKIEIGGFDIQADPVSAKKLMGYVPDMPFLYERLTPTEYMQFAADLYEVPPARMEPAVEEFFEIFGLQEYRDVLIKDLSHGYRQRLIYASTFLHDPQVLFVDEPLMGLDPASIRMIKQFLVRKARGGMTIFFSTHILTIAEDIADRIGIILQGNLIAVGTHKELSEKSGVDGRLEDIFLSLTAASNNDVGRTA